MNFKYVNNGTFVSLQQNHIVNVLYPECVGFQNWQQLKQQRKHLEKAHDEEEKPVSCLLSARDFVCICATGR